MSKDWIVIDENENVVGKWRQKRQPPTPDGLTIKEVDDIDDYDLDYWFHENSE